jgi:hypothetical protein
MAELAGATRVQTVGRNPFDAEVAWTTVAALEDDAEEYRKALDFVGAANSNGPLGGSRASCFVALWAFMRGEWNDPSLRPDYPCVAEPFVAVLQAWGALERGGDPGAAVATARSLAADPEMRLLAAVLEGHALVRAGRVTEAVGSGASAIDSLMRGSRTDVLALAWLALAYRVNGEIADALGDRRAADQHYRRAAVISPKCWFGRPPRRS